MSKHHHKNTSETAPQPMPATPEWEKEKQELIEHLQRLQAEFDNYRKRVEREQEQVKELAGEKLLRELLPISDSLQLSLQHAKDEHGKIRAEDLLAGLVLVNEQFNHLLHHQGLEEIKTDVPFDPKLHEALMTTDDAPKGTIMQAFQRGYLRNGRVFRPAKVSVGR